MFDVAAWLSSPWYQAWQRAAADSMAAAARDPRLMRLSTGLLRSQLLWTRAWQSAVAATLAPLDALAEANKPPNG
jgi:hypothetical protein